MGGDGCGGTARGAAPRGWLVQFVPMKPTLKAPANKRLKLQYDELPSNSAFKFNLRRYNVATERNKVGRCRLN